MKLIKELGLRFPTENSTQRVRFGLFLCPMCNSEIEARLYSNNVKRARRKTCEKCAKSINGKGNITHGYNRHPIVRAMRSMKSRCYNDNDKKYNRYGGVGVTICDEWLNDDIAFVKWSLSNGWRKGLQIDKDILSKKLGISPPLYSPETCMWVTPKENQNEARNRPVDRFDMEWNYICSYDSVADACEELGGTRTSSNIGNYIKGSQKHAYGSRWRYKDD